MPSAAFGASPALPLTALPDDESGLNTELPTDGVGCDGEVAFPTLVVSATPCSCSPLHYCIIQPSRHSSVDVRHTGRKNESASVHSAGSQLPDADAYIRLSGGETVPFLYVLHSDTFSWLCHFGMSGILCLQRLSRLNVHSAFLDLTAITVEVGLLVRE